MAKDTATKALDFDAMTTDEIQAWEDEQESNLQKAKNAKQAKLKEARSEGVTQLISIVKKYQFTGEEFVKALLENRVFLHADINSVKPLYLLAFPITKTKDDVTKDAYFYYFEGKSIISDQAYAKRVTALPFEQFTAYLTPIGKEWLADAEKRKVIIKFYNEYTTQPKQAMELPPETEPKAE